MTCGAQGSVTLAQVSKLFSDWRETRPAKGPIPESLVSSIAQLDESYRLSAVAKVLSLNSNELKKKLTKLDPGHRLLKNGSTAKAQAPRANLQPGIEVTKIIAVEKRPSVEAAAVEIVSPGGWVLRSSTGPINELQILEFARAVSAVKA